MNRESKSQRMRLRQHSGHLRRIGNGRGRSETGALPVLICFAGDRWAGNPHSRHHLMRRFAGEFEVLFIEGLAMRSMGSFDRTELRRVWGKLRAGVGLHTPFAHLHVLSTPPIPPSGRLGRAAQLAVIRGQIRSARTRLGLAGAAVTWFSVPVAAPLRGRFGEAGSLLYYQDRYDQFTGVDQRRLRELTSSLARGCDYAIATSSALAADLERFGARPLVVGHGVDLQHFTPSAEPARELAEFARPLVGYVGILDDYLSFEAIRATAERMTKGTVVLVGNANTDVSGLEHPRIRRIGFRPYDVVPHYLAAFDCCLVPFAMNELSQAVNPIKLREYLAMGRPVVSTALPAVLEYADVVAIAHDPHEFAAEVIRQLEPASDTPDARQRRRNRVRGESWDGVADRIRPILLELAGRGRPIGTGHSRSDAGRRPVA